MNKCQQKRLSVGLITLILLLTLMLPKQVHASIVMKYSSGEYLYKSWEDNDDALGKRPETVTYKLYSYTGTWEGIEKATLERENLTFEETAFYNQPDTEMAHFLNLIEIPDGDWDSEGKSLPDTLDFNGNIIRKYRLVENVPDGYVEKKAIEPNIIIKSFEVGEFTSLESQGDLNTYPIADFDEILEFLSSTDRATVTDSYTYRNWPIITFQHGEDTFVFAFGVTGMGDIVNRYYGIYDGDLSDYVTNTYGEDAKVLAFPSYAIWNNLLSDESPYEDDENIILYYYGISINRDGTVTILPTIEDEEYVEGSGWQTTTKPNPFYRTDESDEITVQTAFVTPDTYHMFGTKEERTSINKLKEPISVTVQKIWNDADNVKSTRPESIAVSLLANGKVTDTQNLSADNNWTYSWSDLPDYENGEKMEYTVEETSVPDGYKSVVKNTDTTVEKDTDGLNHTKLTFEITNTLSPEDPQNDSEDEPNQEDEDENGEDVSPKTSDDSSLVVWIGALVLSAVLFYSIRRKQHTDK